MINFNNEIVRVEDLPYYVSPPMQFSISQSASLVGGQYPFTSGRATLTGGEKNITDNTLLYIKSMSFSASIGNQDYQDAIQLTGGNVDIPNFQVFFQDESNAPFFQDAIILNSFFSDQEFKALREPKVAPNRLSGHFRGTLQQHGGLAGVNSISLTMQLWVQSITGDNFINGLKLPYPEIRR